MGTWTPSVEGGFKFYKLDVIDESKLDSKIPSSIKNNSVPITEDAKKRYLTALKNLYERSATAAAIIDEAIRSTSYNPDGYFYFINVKDDARAYPKTNAVILDPAYDHEVMNSDGKLTKYPLENVLIHEMIHAVLGLKDRAPGVGEYDFSNPDFNFPGPTQAIANIVAAEMSSNFNRIWYDSSHHFGYFTSMGWATELSYTENNTVTGGGLLRFSAPEQDINIDLSRNKFPYLDSQTIQIDKFRSLSVPAPGARFNNRELR